MKKIISLVLAMVLVLSSMSALAAGVAPATGDSPIEVEATAKGRTIKVVFNKTPFDAADDVTFLFYAPETDEAGDILSNNILEENIIHADQIDYNADGFTFAIDTKVAAGKYNLLVGGTDVDFPYLTFVELGNAVKKGNVNLSEDEKVDSADLLELARYVAKYETIINTDANAKEAANVTNDAEGKVDSADLLKLARYVAKYAVDLEAEGDN